MPSSLPALSVCGLLGVALGLGCAPKERRLALKEGLRRAQEAAAARPLAVDGLRDMAGLTRALAKAPGHARARLGPRTLQTKARYRLTEGGAPRLEVRVRSALAVEPDGDFWLSTSVVGGRAGAAEHRRGRRCGSVGGAYFSGRAEGPMSEVPVEAAEDQRCLGAGWELINGLVPLFAGELKVAAVEPGSLMGRPTLRVRLARARRAFDPPPPLPLAWPPPMPGRPAGDSSAIYGPRDWLVKTYARPAALEGEIVFDVQTGLVVAGALEGRFGVRKADRGAALEVRVEMGSRPLDGPIEAPAEVVAYGPRQRIVADEEALLGTHAAPDTAPLPKPGDAPPLRVGPDEETPAAPAEQTDDDEDRPEPPSGGPR